VSRVPVVTNMLLWLIKHNPAA